MKPIEIENNHILTRTKKELFELGETNAQTELESGDVDASELLIRAKKAVEYLTGFIAGVLPSVTDELYQNQYNEVNVFGAIVSLGSTGDRLDYDKDLEYLRRKKALKDREDLLKLATRSNDEIIDSDGGIVEPVPLKSASKEIVKVRL